MPIEKPAPIPGTVILSPRFLATVDYYALMSRYTHAIIDTTRPFNKRDKATHRSEIIDANGPAMITVPIEKPRSLREARDSDIIVSAHGAWWNVVMTAIRSAYGRTPFYEYYEDCFTALINSSAAGRHLMHLNADLDALLRRLMIIPTIVAYGSPDAILAENEFPDPVEDFRTRRVEYATPVEYYQLRASKYGFLPHLSAIDLLFNLGPEAPLLLSIQNI